MEWLKERGWEPVRKAPRKPMRLRVVPGGWVHERHSALATSRALVGLLDRIEWKDYVLNDGVRRQIREMLCEFSDDEFNEFCDDYRDLLSSSNKRRSLFL